ncbi:MAG: hypothetical protein IGQ45_00140 [Cyanobacterium sp. T60_A2020_053]|nr:hypothetical protein [Cyanobacterium sp. T60_A2020_053]
MDQFIRDSKLIAFPHHTLLRASSSNLVQVHWATTTMSDIDNNINLM